MVTKAIRFRFFVLILIVFIQVSFVDAQTKYPETISVLQAAYQNEIQAYLNYMAYAHKAKSENYPNLFYLFIAFASSEAIHARNFKQVLSDLGVDMKEPRDLRVKLMDPRENLKSTLDFEMLDIDQRYPQLIERAKSETHESAL